MLLRCCSSTRYLGHGTGSSLFSFILKIFTCFNGREIILFSLVFDGKLFLKLNWVLLVLNQSHLQFWFLIEHNFVSLNLMNAINSKNYFGYNLMLLNKLGLSSFGTAVFGYFKGQKYRKKKMAPKSWFFFCFCFVFLFLLCQF